MDVMNVQEQQKVAMLYADSNRSLCRAVQLYADGQQAVEIVAAVTSGWEVLRLLDQGLRPQVLVLDSLLSGPSLSHILTRLCLLDDRPRVILTALPGTQTVLERFLTMGADYIIFKPYPLEDLFAEAYHFCVDDTQWDTYRAKARFWQLLRAMKYNRRLSGWLYLERCVLRLVFGRQDYSAKELYLYAVEGEHILPGTVSSALQRINESLRQTGPEGYAALSQAIGKPAGSHMSNLELIRSLSEAVRRILH